MLLRLHLGRINLVVVVLSWNIVHVKLLLTLLWIYDTVVVLLIVVPLIAVVVHLLLRVVLLNYYHLFPTTCELASWETSPCATWICASNSHTNIWSLGNKNSLLCSYYTHLSPITHAISHTIPCTISHSIFHHSDFHESLSLCHFHLSHLHLGHSQTRHSHFS